MAESPVEKLFREAASGLWWEQLPLVQEHPVVLEGHRYRVDFAVPDHRFAIEIDGHATHSSPAAIGADRERQRVLERAGWTVCRFGGREVVKDAARCVREALGALCNLVVDDVSDRDRTWFEEHPHVVQYRRPVAPGEFPFRIAPGTRVLVSVTAWGRVRSPLGGVDQDAQTYPAMAKLPPAWIQAVQDDVDAQAALRG